MEREGEWEGRGGRGWSKGVEIGGELSLVGGDTLTRISSKLALGSSFENISICSKDGLSPACCRVKEKRALRHISTTKELLLMQLDATCTLRHSQQWSFTLHVTYMSHVTHTLYHLHVPCHSHLMSLTCPMSLRHHVTHTSCHSHPMSLTPHVTYMSHVTRTQCHSHTHFSVPVTPTAISFSCTRINFLICSRSFLSNVLTSPIGNCDK